MNLENLLDRLKVFELLMKNNADVKTINNDGETILFFVARSGGNYGKDFSFKLNRTELKTNAGVATMIKHAVS